MIALALAGLGLATLGLATLGLPSLCLPSLALGDGRGLRGMAGALAMRGLDGTCLG